MFDTHCHLNFKRFGSKVGEVIDRALQSDVGTIVVPGTDTASSEKAVAMAHAYPSVYAAVGIHPHHLFELYVSHKTAELPSQIAKIDSLLSDPRALAVGEVGIDRHEYRATKYEGYAVSDEFVLLQKQALMTQLQLAAGKGKSLILHNREAKHDLLEVLDFAWSTALAGRTVFHCCEPDRDLLAFAGKNEIFIGVDGDLTYDKTKQEFIRQVPLELLVLETDAPYLLPEPLRSERKFPNEPAYLIYTAELVAKLKGLPVAQVKKQTTANARYLFGLPEDQ